MTWISGERPIGRRLAGLGRLKGDEAPFKAPDPGTVQTFLRNPESRIGPEPTDTADASVPAPAGRTYLFLRGHPSGFWRDLASALEGRGHRILKVNLCLADAVFWRRRAMNYRGRPGRWPTWLGDLLRRERVTDIVYYADRHPYHEAARAVSRDLGIRCWAIEFGYLRPDWLTLEEGGMGPISAFPRSRAEISALALGRRRPDMRHRFVHKFAEEAFNEVTFNLIEAFGRPFYPLYHADKIYWPALDYLSWLPVLATARRRERQAAEMARALATEGRPFNLVPLQLQSDYQVRKNAPYQRIEHFLEETIASFARHAPANRELVVKVHPLDNGLERWFARTRKLAKRHNVGNRVHTIRGGDLATLLKASKGTVLINSTVGIHALRFGIPVLSRGDAVYDLPGLTHQGGIDTFWSAPDPVDRAFYETFERALTAVQVKGSFFDPAGRAVAIAEICKRLDAVTAPIHSARQCR